MNNRRVVIVDVQYDFPNKSGQSVEEIVHQKKDIWEQRILEMEKLQEQKIEHADSFNGVFYPSIEKSFHVSHISQNQNKFLLSSEKITLSLFQALIDRNRIGAKQDLLVSVGTANTDILSKIAFMNMNVDVLAESVSLIDPLGYIKLLRLDKPPAIESISEASTSGVGAIYSAFLKIQRGEFDIALTGGASASTFPFPFELSHFGVGPVRNILPFEAGGAGHYFSEGGVAFLLKERELALADGDQILAEIKDISSGTMGSVVVNRNAIKKLVLKSFQKANLSEDTEILLELYGRGNEIDDAAEFSCLKNLRKIYSQLKGGYLKEDVHYIVGHYGMVGLCRLLDAEKQQASLQGSTIRQPNRFIGTVDQEVWTTNVSAYEWVSILNYSMHGNSYNMVLNLDRGQSGTRG